MLARDRRYVDLLLEPIRKCADYKPKMGTKGGVSLADFRRMHGADPFYSWLGLDNSLLYASHKASGGMTSIYRQVGIGGERLFRSILQDEFGLSAAQSNWSYTRPAAPGQRARTLALDGRITLADLKDTGARDRVHEWLVRAAVELDIDPDVIDTLQGAVFEVRQGYKSKDSKRQNADLANAATAYTKRYLPVIAILSTQIDGDVAQRYRDNRWGLLVGSTSGGDLRSTFVFMRDVVGYDLAAFLERNTGELKYTVNKVLEALLTPS